MPIRVEPVVGRNIGPVRHVSIQRYAAHVLLQGVALHGDALGVRGNPPGGFPPGRENPAAHVDQLPSELSPYEAVDEDVHGVVGETEHAQRHVDVLEAAVDGVAAHRDVLDVLRRRDDGGREEGHDEDDTDRVEYGDGLVALAGGL